MLELLALSIGLSVNEPIHSESAIDYSESAALHLKVGSNFYGWGSVAKGDVNILGQKTSDMLTVGAGLGYKFELQEDFNLFVEGGIGYAHNKNNYEIQQEVVYTYLVDRHSVYNRPIPVEVLYPYDQESYSTTWEVDYGPVIRAGATYNVTEHFQLGLAYKFFNPKGKLELYDEEKRAAGLGYWEEYVSVNMNVIELSITYEF